VVAPYAKGVVYHCPGLPHALRVTLGELAACCEVSGTVTRCLLVRT
jgi:hypothetical protein